MARRRRFQKLFKHHRCRHTSDVATAASVAWGQRHAYGLLNYRAAHPVRPAPEANLCPATEVKSHEPLLKVLNTLAQRHFLNPIHPDVFRIRQPEGETKNPSVSPRLAASIIAGMRQYHGAQQQRANKTNDAKNYAEIDPGLEKVRYEASVTLIPQMWSYVLYCSRLLIITSVRSHLSFAGR